MVSYKKILTSLFVIISGLLMLIFLYCMLIVDINLNKDKPNLVNVIMLLLTHFIFIGSVFILGSVFNFAKSTKKRVLIAVMVISFFPTMYFGYEMYQNILEWSFTPEKWNSHSEERIYMVDEMLEKNELRGKSREEIENLLGKGHQQKDNVVQYGLGAERGLISIKVEVLTITYDQYGKVSLYGIGLH